MSRSTKIGALCVGLALVSFRLLIFAVEFFTEHKQTLPVAAYVAQPASGGWFAFADGILDLTQATYFGFLGEGKANDDVYIPVYPVGDSVREAPVILLRSQNREYLNLVNHLHGPDENAVVREVLEHSDRYIIRRDLIEGYRANLESGQSGKLYEHFPTVKIILDENESPAYGVATVLALIWAVLLFFVIQNIRTEREERELERFYNEQQGQTPAEPKQ